MRKKSRFEVNSTAQNADSSVGSLSANISKANTENRLDIKISDKRTSLYYRDMEPDANAGVIFKEEYDQAADKRKNPVEKKKTILNRMKDSIASRALMGSYQKDL